MNHQLQLLFALADHLNLLQHRLAALLATMQGGGDFSGQLRDFGGAGYQLGVEGGGDLFTGAGDQFRGLRQRLPALLVGSGDTCQLWGMRSNADCCAQAGADALVQACAEVIQARHPAIVIAQAGGEVVLVEQRIERNVVRVLAWGRAQ